MVFDHKSQAKLEAYPILQADKNLISLLGWVSPWLLGL